MSKRISKKEAEGQCTEQQRTFVEEYIKTRNGKDAAAKAGYKNPAIMAVRLRKLPQVAKLIASYEKKVSKRLTVDLAEIIEQAIFLATRTSDDFVDPETGMLLPLHKLGRRAKASIDSIEQDVWTDEDGNEHVKTKLRLPSKVSGIELLMKHKGAFAPEKHEHKVIALNWDALTQPSPRTNARLAARIANPTAPPPVADDDDIQDVEFTLTDLMDGEGAELDDDD